MSTDPKPSSSRSHTDGTVAVNTMLSSTATLRISLPRMRHTIQCLFVERCSVYLPISVPYCTQKYLESEVVSDSLENEIKNIASSLCLDVDRSNSEQYKCSRLQTYTQV